jgi:hypothetical protein
MFAPVRISFGPVMTTVCANVRTPWSSAGGVPFAHDPARGADSSCRTLSNWAH